MLGGSPFIMSRWKMIGFGCAVPHRIGFWLKSPAKKWLTVVELRRGVRISDEAVEFWINPEEK